MYHTLTLLTSSLSFQLALKKDSAPKSADWHSEYRRLSDSVPRVQCQVLSEHRDEVLHVSFSHDGRQIASCSKDNKMVVWNHDLETGRFFPHYSRSMLGFQWRHTWAAQFSPADTRLMVAGVTSTVGGEVAIFATGRGSDERYRFLCRVVNDPYDVLGCWVSERYFLSGTFITDLHAELQVLIWLCDAEGREDEEPQQQKVCVGEGCC